MKSNNNFGLELLLAVTIGFIFESSILSSIRYFALEVSSRINLSLIKWEEFIYISFYFIAFFIGLSVSFFILYRNKLTPEFQYLKSILIQFILLVVGFIFLDQKITIGKFISGEILISLSLGGQVSLVSTFLIERLMYIKKLPEKYSKAWLIGIQSFLFFIAGCILGIFMNLYVVPHSIKVFIAPIIVLGATCFSFYFITKKKKNKLKNLGFF